ncbi:MAG: isoprenylcysteine carboxylmethyltransferase family protein [Halobacteriales archaeon]|nr:isoprenylcysteine carboxylmethyltransferase family protein [Halobacteriales archaeon]
MANPHRRWRWGNFPVPEAHLIVGAAGVVLGVVWPWTADGIRWWSTPAGSALIGLGVGLMVWATRSAGRVRLADPDRIVTEGAYAISRHPMYVAWTLVYLGTAAILASAWLLVLLPLLAMWVHIETGREEQRMIQEFGSVYTTYQNRVRRYL